MAKSPFQKELVENYLDQCGQYLSQMDFAEAWAEGQALSFEEAITFAREAGES